MSKGGAGKVYFVLYLAVILELLIIFIERDEAEENLRRKEREAILIVQTILSQLQTGSGYTGITASPKDNIVLDPKDPKKDVRNYTVFVAVGDPKASSGKGGKIVHGDDVSKLEYIVSHLADDKKPENELGPDSADIEGGSVIFRAGLGMDYSGYKTPQALSGSPPTDDPANYFTLNEDLTNEQVAKGRRVKVFGVNFKPNTGPGWYRLRFYSETNKILGVAGEPKNDDTVRIGNVKLTVKQLRAVQKALRKQRGADDAASRVEGYIEKLLTADAYKRLPENQGFTSFNVHVVRPDLPPPAEPFAQIASPRDTIYWLSVAPFQVKVTLGPKEATRKDVSGAQLKILDPANNLYLATIENPQPGANKLTAVAVNGGKQAVDDKVLYVESPRLRGDNGKSGTDHKSGIDGWRGLTAVYGQAYDPSSEWLNPTIPADHYQTVVTIRGKEVLNRAGVSFKNLSDDLKKEMTVAEGTKPEEIVTKVFWKPGGTSDQAQWKLLISNQDNQGQAIPLEKKHMRCVYRAPELVAETVDYTVRFNPRNKTWTSPSMQAVQKVGGAEYAADVTVSCPDCDKDNLTLTVNQVDKDFTVTLTAPSDLSKLVKLDKDLAIGRKFPVTITMRRQGDPRDDEINILLQVALR